MSASAVEAPPFKHLTSSSILLPPTQSTSSTPPSQSPSPISDLDLSLPLSTLLKSSTRIAHTQAEHSPGAIALASGTLPVGEYVRYLVGLWRVYKVLEGELDGLVNQNMGQRGAEFGLGVEALDLLWSDRKGKGSMLRRSHHLANDITYFLNLFTLPSIPLPHPHNSLKFPFPTPAFIHPLLFPAEHPSVPSDLSAFLLHLKDVGPRQPGLLLAHAYVRYLGDLSGGQIVAQKIRRVYNLPVGSTLSSITNSSSGTTGTGVDFYHFDLDSSIHPSDTAGIDSAQADQQTSLDAASNESLFERKKKIEEIKGWFRDCMDVGVGSDAESEAFKGQLVNEAITSFHLSTRIFNLLDPTSTSPSLSTTLIPPHTSTSKSNTSAVSRGVNGKVSLVEKGAGAEVDVKASEGGVEKVEKPQNGVLFLVTVICVILLVRLIGSKAGGA